MNQCRYAALTFFCLACCVSVLDNLEHLNIAWQFQKARLNQPISWSFYLGLGLDLLLKGGSNEIGRAHV